jgi:riboflavin-specific deaminase-like protein
VIHPRPLLQPEPGRGQERPYLAINMVATADGRAAVDGSAVGIGSPADKRLMRELRAEADVVLHGAGTVRADPLSARVPPELVPQRVASGLSPQPLGAIVTRSGNLPVHHPYYESATVVYVLSDREVRIDSKVVEVCHLGTVTDVVRDLGRRGVKRILCEGGPTLNSALFQAELIDDVFLTVAPKLVGGDDPLTIVKGPRFARTLLLDLKSLVDVGGELFLHYRVIYPTSQA